MQGKTQLQRGKDEKRLEGKQSVHDRGESMWKEGTLPWRTMAMHLSVPITEWTKWLSGHMHSFWSLKRVSCSIPKNDEDVLLLDEHTHTCKSELPCVCFIIDYI
jgi:hypothetical protein